MLNIVNSWRDLAPEALVNGATLLGLRGTSLVEEARTLNPACGPAMAEAQERGEVVPGLVFPWETRREAPKVVLLVVTRLDHLGTPRMEDLETALESLRAYLGEHPLRTVAVAAIAAGLPRADVVALMREVLGDLKTEVMVEAGE